MNRVYCCVDAISSVNLMDTISFQVHAYDLNFYSFGCQVSNLSSSTPWTYFVLLTLFESLVLFVSDVLATAKLIAQPSASGHILSKAAFEQVKS